MSVIRWEDPPPENHSGVKTQVIAHDLIAYQLRKRPGEWGVICEIGANNTGSPALARDIKVGKLRAYRPAGSFDAVLRKIGDLVTVYARYVGEVKS